ncbi:MAG: phage holin family protein [Comamonadaceae bacterium]|nr:phage holin family protein [Comamonadaceae bacterium]
MEQSTVPPAAAATPPTGDATSQPAREGWLEGVQSVLRELPGLVSDRVELLSLELRRAGKALAQIVVLVVAATLLGVTAWLALWAGVTIALLQTGMHWALALLAVLAANLVAAALALLRIRKLIPVLQLPATRRHLTLSPAASAAAGTSKDESRDPSRAAAAMKPQTSRRASASPKSRWSPASGGCSIVSTTSAGGPARR